MGEKEDVCVWECVEGGAAVKCKIIFPPCPPPHLQGKVCHVFVTLRTFWQRVGVH